MSEAEKGAETTEPVVEEKEQTTAEKIYEDKGDKESDKKEDPGEAKEKEPEKSDEKDGDEKGTEKSEGDKTDDSKVPEVYKLEIPKDSQITDKHVEETALYAKEQGLSQEQAQSVLEREGKIRQEASEFAKTEVEEAYKSELKTKVEQWKEDVENDKEIGGEKAKETLASVTRLVSHFGDETMAKILEGEMGSHPSVIKFLAKIGKAGGEDLFVTGDAKPNTPKSHAQRIYGN